MCVFYHCTTPFDIDPLLRHGCLVLILSLLLFSSSSLSLSSSCSSSRPPFPPRTTNLQWNEEHLPLEDAGMTVDGAVKALQVTHALGRDAAAVVEGRAGGVGDGAACGKVWW